ncbi:MAG: hypothetical protein JSV35_04105 [Candidatus Bathyarchaeota archaeon]|nr:MAG: hypothetical protein JSV35_04105 [Candidatus Bathyarchaeota archaeon]
MTQSLSHYYTELSLMIMHHFKGRFTGTRTKLALISLALVIVIAGITTIIYISEAEQPGSGESQSCSYEQDFHLREQRALDQRKGAAFNPVSPTP